MSSPKAQLEKLPRSVQVLLALGAVALAAFPLVPSDSADFYLQMLSQMMILAIFSVFSSHDLLLVDACQPFSSAEIPRPARGSRTGFPSYPGRADKIAVGRLLE